MTAHDLWLEPPEPDEYFIELDEPAGDYDQEAEAGDFGSDEIERTRDQRYDR